MSPESLSAEQKRRVEQTQPLVGRLASMMSPRLALIGEDELMSVGYEALVRCGLRYDPSMGVPFHAYAFSRVRGAMLDAARRAVPGLRNRGRALRVLQATQALLERLPEHGPDPRGLEQRVEAASDLVANTTTVVMLARRMPRDPEQVADAADDLEMRLDDARVRQRLAAVLDRCSEEERELLHAIYDEGETITEMAQRLGRHKSTISRRHAALIQRLSDELAAGA